MKRHSSLPPIAVALLAAAGTITACSESTTPVGPKRSPEHSASAEGAGRSLQMGALTVIDVPGAAGTLALDINASGVIVGRYLSGGRTHGFLRQPTGELSTIDFPGSVFTAATSINDSGVIVGQYALPSAPTARHGFMLKDGAFTTFDPDGSTFTNVLGINARGDIVGRYCVIAKCTAPGAGGLRAYWLHDGTFTFIDLPGSLETDAFSVNNSGVVFGGFVSATGAEQGFVLRQGEVTTFGLPNGRPLGLDKAGINERGDIVGVYCDGAPPCLIAPTGSHGFLLTGDQFQTIDVPDARSTATVGINARGDVVGGYYDASGVIHGFLLSR